MNSFTDTGRKIFDRIEFFDDGRGSPSNGNHCDVTYRQVLFVTNAKILYVWKQKQLVYLSSNKDY